jgi:hypothetical protein
MLKDFGVDLSRNSEIFLKPAKKWQSRIHAKIRSRNQYVRSSNVHPISMEYIDVYLIIIS